jgi:hypothetical protein
MLEHGDLRAPQMIAQQARQHTPSDIVAVPDRVFWFCIHEISPGFLALRARQRMDETGRAGQAALRGGFVS